MIKKQSLNRQDNPNSDLLFSLRDENTNLKKQITSNDINTKKLLYKVQKLSEQLSKTGQTVNPTKKDDRENVEFVKELQKHVETLNQSNHQLKTKVSFYRTMHESEMRKKTQYSHIPPRIESGSTKRSSSHSKQHTLKSSAYVEQQTMEIETQRSTIAELQELVNNYRSEISTLNGTITAQQDEVEQMKAMNEQLQKTNDIERIASQHELNELKKKFIEQRNKLDSVDEQLRHTTKSYKEINETMENLGKDLQSERKKCFDLETKLKDVQLFKESSSELEVIIEDLKHEKALLQSELDKIMENKFATQRDDEYQAEILVLKSQINSMDERLQTMTSESLDLRRQIVEAHAKHSQVESERQSEISLRISLQKEVENLRLQLLEVAKTQSEQPSKEDLEEAFALLRLKRETGLTFEFLSNVHHIEEDKDAISDLRRQYSECVQELDKTITLLKIQEEICNGLNAKTNELIKKEGMIKNEYELRLEEFSKLADIRKHRIDTLERQLQSLGFVEDDLLISATDKHSSGENLFELKLHGALIFENCLELLFKTSNTFQNPESLVTAVLIDFFDYESEISPIGVGLKPIYDYTVRYHIVTDDYFLHYLQSKKLKLTLIQSHGIEAVPFGYCIADLSSLASTKKNQSSKLKSDIYLLNSNTVIGVLEYTTTVNVPIPLSVQAFKERNLALNLQQNNSSVSEQLKAGTNNFTIYLKDCTFQMQKSTPKSPKIFAAIQFEPALRCILTPVVIGNMNPNFDFKSVIPLQITADLDRHLRTSKMVIVFADDEKTDHIYGFCKIGLSKMIYEQSLNESVDICNKNGDVTGKLNIMLSWDVPYIQHNPTVISIHDQSEISLELSGVVNDLPTISTQPMISEAEPIHPTLNKEEPSLLMPQQQIVEAKPISDVSSNNESDSDPINVNINHTDSKLESKPHAEEEIFSSSLGIQMNSLTIHLNDQRVQSTFSNTQQIFVCVELLNLSGPDFESNSIVINGGKSFDVGYNKVFPFASISSLAGKTVEELMTYESILFSVVEEPPPSDDIQTCVDLGYAKVHIGTLIEEYGQDPMSLTLSIISYSSSLCLGTLKVKITGLADFLTWIQSQ